MRNADFMEARRRNRDYVAEVRSYLESHGDDPGMSTNRVAAGIRCDRSTACKAVRVLREAGEIPPKFVPRPRYEATLRRKIGHKLHNLNRGILRAKERLKRLTKERCELEAKRAGIPREQAS